MDNCQQSQSLTVGSLSAAENQYFGSDQNIQFCAFAFNCANSKVCKKNRFQIKYRPVGQRCFTHIFSLGSVQQICDFLTYLILVKYNPPKMNPFWGLKAFLTCQMDELIERGAWVTEGTKDEVKLEVTGRGAPRLLI